MRHHRGSPAYQWSSAHARSILEELRSNPDRKRIEVDEIAREIQAKLVEQPSSHGAVVGAKAALEVGLPIKEIEASSDQWQRIWGLWARYALINQQTYESESALQTIPWPGAQQPG